MRKMKFELRDQYDGSKTLKGEVESVGGFLAIRVDGYGDHCSNDGEGHPVILELFEGKLRLAVWDDINQEDCTMLIGLEGAKESLRKKMFMNHYTCDNCGTSISPDGSEEIKQ